MPAPILSKKQTAEAHKEKLLRKEVTRSKNKDGHVRQRTKNICVHGCRRSLFVEMHWQSFT